MEAKHFMVGDYVLNNEGMAFRVAQVNDACYGEHTSDLILENGEEYKEVDAIEITEDRLERNGFKYYGDSGWWLEDDFFDIHIYEWSDSIWVFRYEGTEMNTPYEQRVISYFHELQHAFRDCGIEQELIL